PANYDPLGRATERVSDIIMLDREVRTSKEVFNAANYPAGNKENLAAADQWDNDKSKPIKKIVTALDK
ncbi:phage capsid protein, partial [Salmonella enterica]|nr:phage capsid protein [Salmonella enterica]